MSGAAPEQLSWLRRVDAAFGRAYHLVGDAVGISLGVAALAIAIDLLLRLLAIGNLPGMQDVLEHVLFAGVFLAAPWALRMNAHVRVDILLRALPRHVSQRMDRLLDGVGLVVSLILIWYGTLYAISAHARGLKQRGYYTVDEWFLVSVVVLGFALIALEFVFRLLRTEAVVAETSSGHG